ncbi:hypothetical protein COCVIDRAFT_29533 [Bipolaris victoriae FI3]|uniref:NACHT-NTPase and P-loop NTPases N-terminal domain-containing protein n=1 Tax=Bipolaris victoriae (strain FI3) TaxID=930091 RepID=W7E694_BIPV3|nr:hypothetical protein COCVIDRAFT_29533 [Bipolaris victoriae FI3]
MNPLSITESIIDIIGGVSATYRTIRPIKGLPEAFDVVQYHLPLVLRTLWIAQDTLYDDHEIIEDERNNVVAILQSSHNQAQELLRVFDKVKKECENDKDAKEWAQIRSVYHEALRGMEGSTVEQLMKDILGGMKKLASSQIFKRVLQHNMETLEEALEEAIRYILKVEPSLPDLEFNNDERIFTSEQDATGVILQQNGLQENTCMFDSGAICFNERHGLLFGKHS